MYFTKYPHRANFAFAESYLAKSGKLIANGKEFQVDVRAFEGDIFHLRVSRPELWEPNLSLVPLVEPPLKKSNRLKLNAKFEMELVGKEGPLLTTVLGESFGVCGEASLFQFETGTRARYFGMGAKQFGTLELSGKRAKFWSTDVWSDFPASQWEDQPVDPPYFNCPYLVVKVGSEYVGLLIHNPYPAFMETPGTDGTRAFVEWQNTSPHLTLGSEGGEPNLWVIYGPSLAELTQKLQKLVGVTPLPPLWSLGYHQSRYGYGGHDDLTHLDQEFLKHEIPCDSLWLDLDYMDGFRVFQTNPAMFPRGTQETCQQLQGNGRRVVPILDPGVKFEKGYRVYDDGHQKDVFCKNQEGREFVGMVWPGETVFPDFTLEKARAWWTGYVREFFEQGFGACWIDMNDPSTGPVDPHAMLFRNGTQPHAAHHNQYALGMQMATRDGQLAQRPEERPFLLSRSGTTSSSRYAAIWTGDNLSNYFYLRTAITGVLGLSLSGLPFSGPDIGGFGGNASEALIVDWFKACFLFPFFRNHTTINSRAQEPFAYPIGTMQILRRYIRLRYKLLPYLYNLFVEQEQTGAPPLRPLLYHFDDDGLEKVDDQFMVGSHMMQAPIVVEKAKSRTVILPGTELWFDAAHGGWVSPGTVTTKAVKDATALFIRDGAVIPMRPGTPKVAQHDLRVVHFHIFASPTWSGETVYDYWADDGLSFAYQKGERSGLRLTVVGVDGNLAISTEVRSEGYGSIQYGLVIHGGPKSIRLNGSAVEPRRGAVTLTGRSLTAWVVLETNHAAL